VCSQSNTICTTFPIAGHDIYYELYNYSNEMKEDEDTKVFILIHGFLSSCFSFRHLIPLLSKEGVVLVVDLPPFGKSGKNLNFTYSYNNFANIVISMIEHFHFKNIYLIGHSMGGQISLYVAKKAPHLINKIILLCSSGYLGKAQRHLFWSSYIPFFHLIVKRKFAKQGVMKSLSDVVYDGSLIDDDMKQGYEEPFANNEIFRALTKMIRDREGDLSPQEVRNISVPTLLIWGEEDKIVPIEVGKRLHSDLQNSLFISYPKTGHLIPEEIPSTIFENIMSFIG
jgi:pimeloyl-ACP methyl ester carboxylesterase